MIRASPDFSHCLSGIASLAGEAALGGGFCGALTLRSRRASLVVYGARHGCGGGRAQSLPELIGDLGNVGRAGSAQQVSSAGRSAR
jgi:hypothetical protein